MVSCSSLLFIFFSMPHKKSQKQDDTPLEDSLTQVFQEEIDRLKTELETAKTEAETMKETATRALADLQNFKRRNEEERMQFAKYAGANVITNILPALDNLDRALHAIPAELATNEWVTGIQAIEKSLFENLKKEGLEVIPTVGEMIDPEKHEGLMLDPETADGVISQELDRGYLFHGKVLKAAKVKMGTKKE